MKEKIRVRVGVVIPQEDKILLVRHVKDERQYWLLPGGGIKFGETIEECAKREVKEETNMDIKIIRLLFVSESISKEYGRHLINLFLLGKIKSPNRELKVLSDHRVKEARFVPIEKLNELEIHPPVAPFISRAFKEKFQGPVLFLGNLWSFSF